VLSAAVIGLNLAFKVATISVQAFTVVAAALRLGYLTLAAATGSAAAAQALAELTYKNSRVAAILYTAALGVQSVVTKILAGEIKLLTLALLSNPFTAVAVAAAVLVGVLYNLYKNTKALREESAELAATLTETRKEDDADILSAKRHVKARQGLTVATKDLTVATDDGSKASKKAAAEAKKQAEADSLAAKAKDEQNARLQTFTGRLQTVQAELDRTKHAQQNYAESVKNSITSLVDFQKAFSDKGEGSFIDSLRK
jgi:hypothetical protein